MKEFLECGKIVSTHGVRGEVKAEVWMDSPEEMTALKTLYLDGGKTPLTVKGARVHKNMVLLTLAGVETPEAGSALRQKVLFARREDIPLEKGQYFLQDRLRGEGRRYREGIRQAVRYYRNGREPGVPYPLCRWQGAAGAGYSTGGAAAGPGGGRDRDSAAGGAF